MMNFHVYHLTTKFEPANYFANTKVERNCKNLAMQKFLAIRYMVFTLYLCSHPFLMQTDHSSRSGCYTSDETDSPAVVAASQLWFVHTALPASTSSSAVPLSSGA